MRREYTRRMLFVQEYKLTLYPHFQPKHTIQGNMAKNHQKKKVSTSVHKRKKSQTPDKDTRLVTEYFKRETADTKMICKNRKSAQEGKDDLERETRRVEKGNPTSSVKNTEKGTTHAQKLSTVGGVRSTKNSHDEVEARNVHHIRKARTAQSPVHIRKTSKGSINTNAMCKTATTEGVPAKDDVRILQAWAKNKHNHGENSGNQDDSNPFSERK
jgi:hypothetical protein